MFDEAHHAPAYSNRTLITDLRQHDHKMFLLGLTATPTYTKNRAAAGWGSCSRRGCVLSNNHAAAHGRWNSNARPEFQEYRTQFSTEFEARDFEQWRGTYHDLPEEIITQLAESSKRNQFIADTYVSNQRQFGKTIMFADRWLPMRATPRIIAAIQRARADAVYTHINARSW